MVLLTVKRDTDDCFLLEANLKESVDDVTEKIRKIYNAVLKIQRMLRNLDELVKHGVMLPPKMRELTEEQIEELKLVDEWGEKNIPQGGYKINKDALGKRNGKGVNEAMAKKIREQMDKAKAMVDAKQIKQGNCLVLKDVENAFHIIRGSILMIYPMGVPEYDSLQLDMTRFDVSAPDTHDEKMVLAEAALWFCGKQMHFGHPLSHYLGKNDKCKVVVKVTRKDGHQPAREPIYNEDERKLLMSTAFHKQKKWEELEKDEDDSYLNSPWADPKALQKSLHGVDQVKFKM